MDGGGDGPPVVGPEAAVPDAKAKAKGKGKPKAKPKGKAKVKALAKVMPDGDKQVHGVIPFDVRGDGRCIIRHDAKNNKANAHCRHPLHGALCRAGRSLEGRAGNPAGPSLFGLSTCAPIHLHVVRRAMLERASQQHKYSLVFRAGIMLSPSRHT